MIWVVEGASRIGVTRQSIIKYGGRASEEWCQQSIATNSVNAAALGCIFRTQHIGVINVGWHNNTNSPAVAVRLKHLTYNKGRVRTGATQPQLWNQEGFIAGCGFQFNLFMPTPYCVVGARILL